MHIPGLTELDKNQKEIRLMPRDGDFLVTGPPGTGKSVLAVYRYLYLKDWHDRRSAAENTYIRIMENIGTGVSGNPIIRPRTGRVVEIASDGIITAESAHGNNFQVDPSESDIEEASASQIASFKRAYSQYVKESSKCQLGVNTILKKNPREPTLITKSKLLTQYMSPVYINNKKTDLNVQTYDGWLEDLWMDKFNQRPPTKNPWDRFDYDWDKMADMVDKKGGIRDDWKEDLIIDEGQDLPIDFYTFLPHIKPNLTVFADDNQSWNKNPIRVADLKTILGVNKHYEITRNYRNTREIAKVAKRFFTGTGSGYPDDTNRHGDPPEYRKYDSQDAFLERVKIRALNDPSSNIGVFLPRVDSVVEYAGKLTDKLSNTERRAPQMYINFGDAKRKGIQVPVLDFSPGHIIVCTYISAKGLEFDNVFIPALEQLGMSQYNLSEDSNRRGFYILTSRPRTFLELSSHSGKDTRITRELKNEVSQANDKKS